MLLCHFATVSSIVSTLLLFAGVYSQGIRFPTNDDYNPPGQRPPSQQSCDANSFCTTIRRCRPLNILPNWRTVGQTCGFGSGTYRRVCCPRQNSRPSEPQPPVRPSEPRPPVRPSEPRPPVRPSEPRPPVRPSEPRPPVRPSGPRTPVRPPTENPRPTIIPLDNNACGQSRGSQYPYIMGGRNATEGDWPWMVAINERRRRSGVFSPSCTGFLIDRRHVLTAAHCFEDSRDPDSFTTRIGSVNQIQGEVFPIRNIVIPEGYRRRRYYDDIAILTLTRDVNLPNFIPICLPDEELASQNLVGNKTTVAGWGAERPDGPGTIFLKELGDMPVVSIQDCDRAYRTATRSFTSQFQRGINSGFICAGFPEGLQDACAGDSGGPLMLRYRNRWFAIGIVSFGVACGTPRIPGGYTRITTYLNWIRQNTRD